MNWFSRTTSIAGMQVSNLILAIVAVVVLCSVSTSLISNLASTSVVEAFLWCIPRFASLLALLDELAHRAAESGRAQTWTTADAGRATASNALGLALV